MNSFKDWPKKLTLLSAESAAGLEGVQVSFQTSTICSRRPKTPYCLLTLVVFYFNFNA